MDFSRNLVLKEDYAFLVADASGNIAGAEHGLYNRDTRFLSRYAWSFEPRLQLLQVHSGTPDRAHLEYGLFDGERRLLAVSRTVRLTGDSFTDTLEIESWFREMLPLELRLELGSDFADLFEVRGLAPARSRQVTGGQEAQNNVHFEYAGAKDFSRGVTIETTGPLQWNGRDAFESRLELAPRERRTLSVTARLSPARSGAQATGYGEWRAKFSALPVPPRCEPVLSRAIDDLRALLLFEESGPLPAAGIPWYVAPFGRDSLLTALMLRDWAPEVATGTLRFLARHQGVRRDSYTGEAPGKIMHELRQGELAALGEVPHTPYYGSADATALFIILLDSVGDAQLVNELRPNWEAALTWHLEDGDLDGDGFIEFEPAEPGEGLTVQSWKDSSDSLSHADGSLAAGAIAPSEVQGYAYAAYRAAASFYRQLDEPQQAHEWLERAHELQARFEKAFWLEELGTYALALDGEKRPLRVHNSNAGHLLWSGIVPEAKAARLRDTLFSTENWSGWGVRTLGAAELRYNPLSYHNGSVWPHDNALIAAGLAHYGFTDEARRIRDALLGIAAMQPDLRLPELIGGEQHRDDSPPVPYPVSNRPQAWSAASLVYLLTLLPLAQAGPTDGQ